MSIIRLCTASIVAALTILVLHYLISREAPDEAAMERRVIVMTGNGMDMTRREKSVQAVVKPMVAVANSSKTQIDNVRNQIEKSLVDQLPNPDVFDFLSPESFVNCGDDICFARLVYADRVNKERVSMFMDRVQSKDTETSLMSKGFTVDSMEFGFDRKSRKSYFEISVTRGVVRSI